jgi:hypothetical protein
MYKEFQGVHLVFGNEKKLHQVGNKFWLSAIFKNSRLDIMR